MGLVTSTAVTSACKSTGVSQVVDDEVDWAMHMGVPAVMFPPPPGSGEGTEGGADNYARLINSVALKVAGEGWAERSESKSKILSGAKPNQVL